MDEFLSAYLEAMLFCETDNGEEDNDRGLSDLGFTVADIAPEALAVARADCEAFWGKAGGIVAECGGGVRKAAIDFYLTRNGHGAGFWDGDWPDEAGERLTEIADDFGEQSWYVGDDGKVYVI